MPLSDIMGLLGVGGILAAILFPLYYGDDFFSVQFGSDVRNRFLSARVPTINTTPQLVDGCYNWVLGSRLFSVKALLLSSLVFLAASVTAAAIRISEIAEPVYPNPSMNYLWLVPIVGIGALTTLLSLVWTRQLLRAAIDSGKIKEMGKYLSGDLFLSLLANTIGLLLIEIFSIASLGIGIAHLDGGGFLHTAWVITHQTLSYQFFNLFEMLGFVSAKEILGYSIGDRIFSVALWISTLSFSIALWLCLFSEVIIKQATRLNTIHSYVSYLLPLDEKPIRSIGILLYIVIGALIFVLTLL